MFDQKSRGSNLRSLTKTMRRDRSADRSVFRFLCPALMSGVELSGALDVGALSSNRVCSRVEGARGRESVGGLTECAIRASIVPSAVAFARL